MFAPPKRNAKRAWPAGLGALLLTLLAVPGSAQEKPSGAEVWGANCGRCHRVRAVDAYDARQWETVVAHMSLVARLTSDETQAVRDFLVGAARAREARSGGAAAARAQRQPVLLASRAPVGLTAVNSACCTAAVGQAVYKSTCVVCHGEQGKGNGPVAAAMTPRPADLTDPVRMGRLSEDSLVLIVTQGRGAMPGFEVNLTPERVREVVAYIRTLRP